MRYGFVFPKGDARLAAELAQVAEGAGWDGFFVWEAVWGVDAWISLAAAAMVTDRIRLGTLLTPIARMRPWELASKTVTLDHLSGGRVILSVGLGAIDTGYAEFGEVTDRRTRAELMDEGLEILTGLWRGQPFSYQGKHYTIKETTWSQPPPPPVQQPRIPIWVVGVWPRERSMARVARYDGLLASVMTPEGGPTGAPTPADLRAMQGYIEAHRQLSTPFDIIVEGRTPGDDPAAARAAVEPLAEAGATWWIESMWTEPNELADLRRRLEQGPPPV